MSIVLRLANRHSLAPYHSRVVGTAQIIYEDGQMLVALKPAGVDVSEPPSGAHLHRHRARLAAPSMARRVAAALLRRRAQTLRTPPPPGAVGPRGSHPGRPKGVHRLDR